MLPWRADGLLCLFQFLDNKVIVFISSCETVEFLHSLFAAVLSERPANRELRFLRLHGNMKQEVTLLAATSIYRLGALWRFYSECLLRPPGALGGVRGVFWVSERSSAVYGQ